VARSTQVDWIKRVAFAQADLTRGVTTATRDEDRPAVRQPLESDAHGRNRAIAIDPSLLIGGHASSTSLLT
jgi:hypothetical protein